MRKNGFTLIELLAIIVILAVIAVITVPIILNVIENSKKGAVIDSAYGYCDAIKKFYMSKMMADNSYTIENGEYDISFYTNDGLYVSGENPSAGWVMVEDRDITDFSFKIGEYSVTYDSSTDTIIALKNGEVVLSPNQGKVLAYLNSLKTVKGNATDLYVLPVEGVSSTDVTSGWVALNNGEVVGYSLEVGNKELLLSTKDKSLASIVKTLASSYISSLSGQNSETVIDVAESGYLKEGFIEYKSNGTSVVINDYSLKYEIDGVTKYANYVDNELIVENTKHNKPISVGDTVYIGDEGFYVMEVNDGAATLLANTCLINDNDTWRQVTGNEDCTTASFSSINYWDGKVGPGLEYSGNYCEGSSQTGCAYVYDVKNDDINNVKTIVDLYAESLSENATGRVMKLEEAYNLDSSIVNIFQYYWLGSVYGSFNVWAVFSEWGFSASNYSDRSLVVRPVIEIPISDLQ